jgi:hypothetical protein
VVLYRRDRFDAVTGLGDWAGGAFDGTVRVPVEDLEHEVERLKGVLRHELAHAFVHEAGGTKVPGWLNEGLAQWLEPPFLDGRAVVVRRARARLEGTALYPLEQLRGSLASWTEREAIERAYAESLALVAFIEHMYGERVLFEMVSACKAGGTPEARFRDAVGLELAVVVEDLARGL